MTPDQTIQGLERYRTEFTGILTRFVRSPGNYHINREDDPRYRTFVIEVVDLLNDLLGKNKYSALIYQLFTEGIGGYLNTPSYKSIEDIISVLDSALTWLKRNADTLNKTAPEAKIIEPIKTSLEPPKTVTLKWLWEHVPYSLWGLLISLLIGAFILGVTFANTKLYNSLTNLLTPNINANIKINTTKE